MEMLYRVVLIIPNCFVFIPEKGKIGHPLFLRKKPKVKKMGKENRRNPQQYIKKGRSAYAVHFYNFQGLFLVLGIFTNLLRKE